MKKENVPAVPSENRAEFRELEIQQGITFLPPLGSELFSAGAEQHPLLFDVLRNPRLEKEAQMRRELHTIFDTVYAAIPDPTIDINLALENGDIEASLATSLWDGLSNLLEHDENNARILLYLPFEILPNLNTADQSPTTGPEAQRLADVAREAWIRLLHEKESRANFTDGDILEPGLEDAEKVSKAGHLTPQLLEKNIIDCHDVTLLLELINDTTILTSLAEGAIVAQDKGLMGAQWQKADEIVTAKLGTLRKTSQKDMYYNDPNSEKISPERALWLRKREQENQDNKKADLLAEKLFEGDGQLNLEEVDEKVQALGIIKAGLRIAEKNPEKANEFVQHSEPLLRALKNSPDSAVYDAIVGGLHKWEQLKIIDTKSFEKFGITKVDLSSPSHFNEKDLKEEFGHLATAVKKISVHPVLSKNVFPSFLLFGSKIKGYSGRDSDLDAAIFLKPEADLGSREIILETLKRDVPELANTPFLEFWASSNSDKSLYSMPAENTRVFVSDDQIHFLLGGVWVGKSDELLKIRGEILQNYLDLSRFGDNKDEKRQQLLGTLELDALQYRLMHKGYKKYYSSLKKEGTPNSDLIDWDSDFWDPGYRRIATKLFLSKVFLPDLS